MSEARARKLTHFGSTVFGSIQEAPKRSASTLDLDRSLKSLNRYERPTSSFRSSTFASQKYHERSSVLDGVTEKTLKRDTSYDAANFSFSNYKADDLSKSFADLRSVIKTPTCKPKDTRDLLGNERPQFSRTSVNEFIKAPIGGFQPRYKETSAFARKQTEFHGKLVEKMPETSENIQAESDFKGSSSELNYKQRKMMELSSGILEPISVKAAPVTSITSEPEKPKDYSPIGRKNEMLSSSVFESAENRVWEPAPRDVTPETKKFRHHLESNVFNQSFSYPPRAADDKSETDKRSEASPEKSEYCPLARKAKMLGYSKLNIEPKNEDKLEGFEGLKNSPRSLKTKELIGSYQTTTAQVTGEASIYEFSLSNLPDALDSNELKKLCGNVHIVNLETDIDNLTGKCKGTAKIKVRATDKKSKDINDLQLNLAQKGIDLKEYIPNTGKKNNYADVSTTSWADSHLQREEHRLAGQECDARTSKLRLLESNGDIFGSTVGKWTSTWKKQATRKPVDKSFLTNLQWKNTKDCYESKIYTEPIFKPVLSTRKQAKK